MDWNSDGLWDIVSGDRNGYLNVFIRDTLDGLTAYYQYRAMDSTIMTVVRQFPAGRDWTGTTTARRTCCLAARSVYVFYYRNMTSDSWPMFQAAETIRAASQYIYYNRVNPYVFDLNRDDKKDLVCGANDGYVRSSATSPTASLRSWPRNH